MICVLQTAKRRLLQAHAVFNEVVCVHTVENSTTTEKFCLSDGCYDFNINDDYGDGMSGAQYSSCDVDGDYNITDQWQSINYVQMTAAAADYGFGTSHSFCVNNTGLKENLILDFNIYPNPADNSIYIQMLDQSYKDLVDLNIMDLRGRTVLKQTNIIQNGSCFLNIQQLSKGVYMVNLRSDEFTAIKKLIVK